MMKCLVKVSLYYFFILVFWIVKDVMVVMMKVMKWGFVISRCVNFKICILCYYNSCIIIVKWCLVDFFVGVNIWGF